LELYSVLIITVFYLRVFSEYSPSILRVFCEYSAGIACLGRVRGVPLEMCVFGVKMGFMVFVRFLGILGRIGGERGFKREKVQIKGIFGLS
jgi:hypothetical protein